MKKCSLSIFMVMVVASSLGAEDIQASFIKKKEKKVSMQSLRDNCAARSGDVLKSIAQLTQQTAFLQGEILEVCLEHVEGDGQGYIIKADKDSLQDYEKELAELQQKMDELAPLIKKIHKHIKETQEKIKK